MFPIQHANPELVRDDDTLRRPGYDRSRMTIGILIAIAALVGAVRTFDPVALSVAQLLFLVLTITGVAIATHNRP